MSLSFFLLGIFSLMLGLDLFFEFNLLNLSSSSMISLFYLDYKSFLFMSFVLYISSLIMNYSSEYMFGDINLNRFIYLVLLFVFSMMMMILGMNLVSILLGWDGLGLVSYVLVVYYQNVKSYNAGMLTALSNRIGDASLLLAIGLMSFLGSWNFLFYLNIDLVAEVVGIFCILAAFTKSAQIPFSSWLPAAMAAPTPVSALVHSSTLVTAGVYLLIRFSLYFNDFMMALLLFFSLFTMFMAGLCANFEFDLKKIIALSTLSQLGMMLTVLSIGGQDLAFFHLLTHALFKALLFMCAGVIIHSFGNVQDIRMMGGLIYWLPITSVCMNISNFALCGIPFMSGFYSKDLIAETMSMNIINIFIYIVFYLSVGLTVSYSVRLSYIIFFGDFNFFSLGSLGCLNNKNMIISMLFLIFFVVFMGSCLTWLFEITPYFILLPVLLKLMTVIFILMGLFIGIEISYFEWFFNFFVIKGSFLWFISGMWNLPFLSTIGIYPGFMNQGKFNFNILDQGWLEFYGKNGLVLNLISMFLKLQLLSLNYFKLFMYLLVVYFLLVFVLL
uniref:NADH-ubiquinone oxidoreductase chain 5 n=1 Tax=Scolytinae sp. BMNH 1040319 TaxID=1903789 RepID=A0A343A574_9CUCU|nr:NADH dehydrogenase subunit 5 [Scolytinae sp. BMNH 1040319]